METKEALKLYADALFKKLVVGDPNATDMLSVIETYFDNNDKLAKLAVKPAEKENEVLNSAYKSGTVLDYYPEIQTSLLDKGIVSPEDAITSEMEGKGYISKEDLENYKTVEAKGLKI